MQIRQITLLTAAVVSSAPAHASSVPATTPAQAAALVRDVTMDFFDGQTHHYEYFALDGTSTARDSAGRLEKGRWFARPDATVCFMHTDPHQSGCVHVARDAGTISFHRIDGLVEGPFAWEPGNPHGL